MNFEKDFNEIKQMIENNEIDNTISKLNEIIALDPKQDMAYYLLGNVYRKHQDWQKSMNNYTIAIELNPYSPAVQAKKMCSEILDFYDTNRYNH